MMPRWQVQELANAVESNAGAAAKVAAALRPEDWVREGASEAYVDQHAALLHELEQVRLAAQALGREPERLTYAVDTFLWLDRANGLLGSMSAGVRAHSNGAVADLLVSVRNRNAPRIEEVKLYVRQLAVHVEESMRVAHAEAQRCRSEILGGPHP